MRAIGVTTVTVNLSKASILQRALRTTLLTALTWRIFCETFLMSERVSSLEVYSLKRQLNFVVAGFDVFATSSIHLITVVEIEFSLSLSLAT